MSRPEADGLTDQREAWMARGVAANQEGRLAEAEAAFLVVLELEPSDDEAWFGLGLTRMAARRFVEAIEPLERAAKGLAAPPIYRICLGQALYMTGAFAAADQVLAAAADAEPLPLNAWRIWARCRTFALIERGQAEQALGQYPSLAGPGAEDLEVLAREAFTVFAGFERVEAARAVGQWLLARRPDDEVLAYRMRVFAGEAVTAAPPAYVTAHFDAFAEHFEDQLENRLGYRTPRDLAQLLGERRDRFVAMLDLGCGTGLAGPVLSAFGGRLAGVDLSSRMLEKARDKGCYDQLIQADAVAYLIANPGRYDLIFAADMLIYVGSLETLMAAAAQALVPDGCLAVSTETTSMDWTVLNSGRFAHAPDYVLRAASPWFEPIAQRETLLRREGLGEVHGHLHAFRRRSAAL